MKVRNLFMHTNGMAKKCRRKECQNISLQAAWCSPECYKIDNPYVASTAHFKESDRGFFDDFHPTEQEKDRLWECAVRKGIISLELEVASVFLDAQRLRGTRDNLQKEIRSILGKPGRRHPLATLNITRKP
jgi:hypothetical protein